MLSIVWFTLIILSLIFGAKTGNIANVTQSVSVGAKETVTLILSICGIMCFWSGIMEILMKSGLGEVLSRLFHPFLSKIFDKCAKDKQTMRYITANFTANLLGLSNAATPMGLKAAEKIHNLHNEKHTSDDLIMLVVINCSSIQLIPTTVAAIRSNYGAQNPFDIMPAVWITSLVSVLSGIIVAKICKKGGL
ncbi:MAG: nucleoside recognition domain-containing protein [Clostridia bacterium]